MKLETKLSYIAKMAKHREDENWAFRTFLKALDMDDKSLDAIVHRIHDEVSGQIDCTKCGNCCNESRPTLNPDDVKRFAIGLELTETAFRETHLRPVDIDSNEFVFTGIPCQFLDGKRCGHYELRPTACADYPHLHRSGFRGRLMSVVFNYEICPIVYNVYERLKSELWPKKQPIVEW